MLLREYTNCLVLPWVSASLLKDEVSTSTLRLGYVILTVFFSNLHLLRRIMFDGKSEPEYDPNSPSLGATTSVDEDKNSRHEIDPATQYLRDHPEWTDYDHLEAKKVRQKIDWRIMPLMVVTNTIGAVDVSYRNLHVSRRVTNRRRKSSSPMPPCME